MNLTIRGISAHIVHGETFHNDRYPDLKEDYTLANPPLGLGAHGIRATGPQVGKSPRDVWEEPSMLGGVGSVKRCSRASWARSTALGVPEPDVLPAPQGVLE